MMTFILAKFAAGLVIYWTFNNLFSTIQQYIIMRRCGVKVDIIGNFLHQWKKKPAVEEAEDTGDIEGEVLEAEIVEEAPKEISKPKPKKKKATQKKKK